MASPVISMAPPSKVSSRLMHRSSVVLPEPDAPISETTSPLSSVRSIPRRTSTAPKLLCSPEMVRMFMSNPRCLAGRSAVTCQPPLYCAADLFDREVQDVEDQPDEQVEFEAEIGPRNY